MIEILNEVGIGDWQLTSMICKVLMNYSEKTRSNMNYSYFEIEELNLLQMLLSELLGRIKKYKFKIIIVTLKRHFNLDK
jgi:hypothetical protein